MSNSCRYNQLGGHTCPPLPETRDYLKKRVTDLGAEVETLRKRLANAERELADVKNAMSALGMGAQ